MKNTNIINGVEVLKLSDTKTQFSHKDSGNVAMLNENYPFTVEPTEFGIIAWCADKLIVFDNGALFQYIEDDFISSVYIDDIIYLVCDTQIVMLKKGVIKEINRYIHDEIISKSHYRGCGVVEFLDISDRSFSYNSRKNILEKLDI